MVKLGTFDHIVPGKTIEERLANAEALGFEGVQFGRNTLELGWPAIKKAIASTSLKVCIAGGRAGTLLVADKAERAAVVERIKDGLRIAADVGAVGSILVPVAGRESQIPAPAAPKTLYDLEREILIEELSKVAPVAEEVGAKVILEPLNRYETHFLQRVEQGAEICRAIGSPGITVMADFFHMSIEEPNLARPILESGAQIGYVHLADSNRMQPGTGHTDFRSGFTALKQIGYDGWMTFECRVLAGADTWSALQAAQSWMGGVTETRPVAPGTFEALKAAVEYVWKNWELA